jgi:hypothetical protein
MPRTSRDTIGASRHPSLTSILGIGAARQATCKGRPAKRPPRREWPTMFAAGYARPRRGEVQKAGGKCLPFVSITRLRLRSIRFLPSFALYTYRSLRQVKVSSGFQGGKLLADRDWTFWTMTAWDTHESVLRYMTTGSHRAAMPRLLDWCDEASVVHWDQPEASLRSWTEADQEMRANGRVSKVRHPSPQHATLAYRRPRLTTGGIIRAASK